MATVTLVYVGPHSEGVVIAATDQHVKPGEPFEVDAELAGKAPKGSDLGHGLLAQVDNFQPSGKKPTEKEG